MLLNSHHTKTLCITKHWLCVKSKFIRNNKTKTQKNNRLCMRWTLFNTDTHSFFSWGRLSLPLVIFLFCKSKCANLQTFDSWMNLNAFGFFGQKFKLIGYDDGGDKTENRNRMLIKTHAAQQNAFAQLPHDLDRYFMCLQKKKQIP